MLKTLKKSDLELILSWRNNPGVRQAMFTQHQISFAEHQAWFERMRLDPTVSWFLYIDKADQARGVVYFTDINHKQKTAFWGFYISPNAKPGTGLRISLEAIDIVFSEINIYKVNAEVLASNVRSFKMHKKIGFVEEGRFREQYFNGKERVDVIRLGLLVSEWEQHRKTLLMHIAGIDNLAASKKASPPFQSLKG